MESSSSSWGRKGTRAAENDRVHMTLLPHLRCNASYLSKEAAVAEVDHQDLRKSGGRATSFPAAIVQRSANREKEPVAPLLWAAL